MSYCPDCKQDIRIGGPAHTCPERREREANDRLALTPCSALLARIEGMDVRKVAASTQYGMGLVIVIEGAKHLMSGIAYRNDEMTHADRVALAGEANIILRQNVTEHTTPRNEA